MWRQLLHEGLRLIWWARFKPFDYHDYINTPKKPLFALTAWLMAGTALGAIRFMFLYIASDFNFNESVAGGLLLGIGVVIIGAATISFSTSLVFACLLAVCLTFVFAIVINFALFELSRLMLDKIGALIGVIPLILTVLFFFIIMFAGVGTVVTTAALPFSVTMGFAITFSLIVAIGATVIGMGTTPVAVAFGLALIVSTALVLPPTFIRSIRKRDVQKGIRSEFIRGIIGVIAAGICMGVFLLILSHQLKSYPEFERYSDLPYPFALGFFTFSVFISGLPTYLVELLVFYRQLQRARRFEPTRDGNFTQTHWHRCILFTNQTIRFPLPGLSEFLLLVVRHDGFGRIAEDIRHIYEHSFQPRIALQAFKALWSHPRYVFEYLYYLRKQEQWSMLEACAHESKIAKSYAELIPESVRPARGETSAIAEHELNLKTPLAQLSQIFSTLTQSPPLSKLPATATEGDIKMTVRENLQGALRIFEQHRRYEHAFEIIQLYRFFSMLLDLDEFSDIPALLKVLTEIEPQGETLSLHEDYATGLSVLKGVLYELNESVSSLGVKSRDEYLSAARQQLQDEAFRQHISRWLTPEREIAELVIEHLDHFIRSREERDVGGLF